jgi:hypothetical protein
MNSIEQLNNFLARVTSDANLTTTHIGVCTALAVAWINSGLVNPFTTSRSKLMRAARIKSKATYHKVITDLANFSYIKYEPSYHPTKASKIFIHDFNHDRHGSSEEGQTSNYR